MQYAADSKYLAWQFEKSIFNSAQALWSWEGPVYAGRNALCQHPSVITARESCCASSVSSASILEPHSWLKGLSYKRTNPLAGFLYRDRKYVWQELLFKPRHSDDPPAESKDAV